MNLHFPMKHLLKPILGTSIALLALAQALRAEPRKLSIPGYLANPGGFIQVPLMLDNAAGLAAVQVQINFDPEVVKLQSVSSGPLGQAFEMSQGDGDGFVQLTFFRGEALAGGSGRLAVLRFRANPGTVTDLFSELTIADLVLSDGSGVIDLRQKDSLVTQNGQVKVSPLQNIDNTGSGLPDWWEDQHGLDPFVNNLLLDPENDGLPNLLEYAFGGNPKVSDAHARGVRAGRHAVNREDFLSLAFYRRLGDASLHFRLQESSNLGQWTDLNLEQRIIGTPQNMGDGTEFVEVRGTLPMNGPAAAPKGFLRVAVEKP
jgi:hypothetical protein